MNNGVRCFIALLSLCLAAAHAKPPVRYMPRNTPGVEYAAAIRGQLITKAEIDAVERMHLLKVLYSPLEYIQSYFGAGINRLEVVYKAANTHFDGKYGIATTAGLSVNTPAVVRRILRVTFNLDFLYLYTKDSKKYKYRGLITDPSLGLMAHIGSMIDLEGGVMWHFINGTMSDPQGKEYPFSNVENARGYFGLTLCSPIGAFVQLHFDASKSAETQFDNGPVDAAFGLSVGILFPPDQTNKQLREWQESFFPDVEKTKEKKEKMKDELKE
jgi:hypothetical protein